MQELAGHKSNIKEKMMIGLMVRLVGLLKRFWLLIALFTVVQSWSHLCAMGL